MAYLYHGIPDDMKGNKLIPLTQMLALDSRLHAEYLEKYKGREEILEKKIPLLDCLWNDVVQLLPLHPQILFDLQKQMGIVEDIPEYSYFEIDSLKLDPSLAVVYFKTAPGEENVKVQWLADVNLDELQSVPKSTIQYYESMLGTGDPVFNYQFVPHILYKGSVDTTDAKRIKLA